MIANYWVFVWNNWGGVWGDWWGTKQLVLQWANVYLRIGVQFPTSYYNLRNFIFCKWKRIVIIYILDMHELYT